MRCRYCGTGERPVRLVTVLAENSGPGIDVYACTSCRAANDLTPVDEPPSGPDGAERTGRREVCVWCRRTTHAPVVARVLEPSGHTLYQYHGCAWKRCLDHIAECRECHAIGGKCPRALAMWRAISESRARYLTL